jgi:MerR family transcriptional regulator, thiopeptide resistance regulator
MSWTVGEVARIASVTVRTLHHYDEIGLLSPSARTASGYRRYEYGDLERLQRIVAYRQLGFGLDEIKAILDDPKVDPLDHLRRQHELLTSRMAELQQMVRAIERTMEAHKMGIQLNPQEMFEVFGDFDPSEYAEEAERRWGGTDAYRESNRRVSSYTKQDWLQIKADSEQVEQRFAAAFAAGRPADGEEAMDAAEAHRQHISTWFYDCSYDIHRGLAEMYIGDERFTAHYDRRVPGLAAYVHDAIIANADRADAAAQ